MKTAFGAIALCALVALTGFYVIRGASVTVNRASVDAAVFDAARSDGANFDRFLPADAGLRDALKRDVLARDAVRGTQATKITTDDGFNNVTCYNNTSTAVYFGDYDVSSTTGLPVCSASTCVSKTIDVNITQGALYAVTSVGVDGGITITCVGVR